MIYLGNFWVSIVVFGGVTINRTALVFPYLYIFPDVSQTDQFAQPAKYPPPQEHVGNVAPFVKNSAM